MSSLISFLKQVNDWRNSSGQRHPTQNLTPFQENTYTEIGHGREVTRKVSVFEISETVQETWKESQCFVKVERNLIVRKLQSVFWGGGGSAIGVWDGEGRGDQV